MATTPRTRDISAPRAMMMMATTMVLLAIAAASAAIRWPGFTQGRLASHDVGGILYNAMLLRSGGLPYVDSVEWKAPGSFYIAALVPDIAALQVLANLVALTSLLAVTALAWRLWGRGAAIACAAVFALHDAHLDSMDANYVTWALLPQIAAMLVVVTADRRRAAAVPSTRWWLAAGALCGLATLCKQPAGIVLIPAMVLALWGRDVRAGLTVLTGFLAAHVPIALHYLAHGQLGALVASYAGANWGLSYIGHHSDTALHVAAWEGLAATVFFLALPLTLAVFTVAARPRDVDARRTTWLLAIWAVAALLGAAVGLRFYKGYFLAALPPLCLLAAAPWGPLGADFWRRASRWVRAPMLIVLALLVVRAAAILHRTRVDRALPHDDGATKIARHIARHSEPGDRIWVWGWHLWGVYAYSDRLSASPIYKTPGLLTHFDDDTWRRPSTRVKFIADSPHAARLLADLERTRPIFVVLGGGVPRHQFVALRKFLATHYQRDRAINLGKVEIWRRRDGG